MIIWLYTFSMHRMYISHDSLIFRTIVKNLLLFTLALKWLITMPNLMPYEYVGLSLL